MASVVYNKMPMTKGTNGIDTKVNFSITTNIRNIIMNDHKSRKTTLKSLDTKYECNKDSKIINKVKMNQ